MAAQLNKKNRVWWLLVPGLCVLLCLIPYACRPDPVAVLAPIPLGSRLSRLDQYLKLSFDNSEVEVWVPLVEGSTSRTTAYGIFSIRNLGRYEDWDASDSDRDRFTGEILFYHYSSVIPDDLAPSYVFSLIYVNGVLKEKDYGHLPG